MKKTKAGVYQFENFLKINGLVHGFSTRKMGDMNPKRPKSVVGLKTVADTFKIDAKKIVGMNQVNGNAIFWVEMHNGGTIIKQTDGLFTTGQDLFLYGTYADCLPIFFYDKKLRTVGILHAGFRGLYQEVIKKAVQEIMDRGCDSSDILVGIGPSVRVSSYDIDVLRVDMFAKKFPRWKKEILVKKDQKFYLNLPQIAKFQLLSEGIKEENIEDSMVDTFENSEFYSYRGLSNKPACPQVAGIIGRV